jgi:hypothetical protein
MGRRCVVERLRRDGVALAYAEAGSGVTLSAWEQHLLVWDGEEAAAACRVPALLIISGTPLSDLARFQELTPQLVTGPRKPAGGTALSPRWLRTRRCGKQDRSAEPDTAGRGPSSAVSPFRRAARRQVRDFE